LYQINNNFSLYIAELIKRDGKFYMMFQE